MLRWHDTNGDTNFASDENGVCFGDFSRRMFFTIQELRHAFTNRLAFGTPWQIGEFTIHEGFGYIACFFFHFLKLKMGEDFLLPWWKNTELGGDFMFTDTRASEGRRFAWACVLQKWNTEHLMYVIYLAWLNGWFCGLVMESPKGEAADRRAKRTAPGKTWLSIVVKFTPCLIQSYNHKYISCNKSFQRCRSNLDIISFYHHLPPYIRTYSSMPLLHAVGLAYLPVR